MSTGSQAGSTSQAFIVVIGRNEGARLVSALNSVHPGANTVVYVDSGSTDDSVQSAERAGAIVAALDMDKPFSAARARNLGVSVALQRGTTADFVQFMDGDCNLDERWLATATAFLVAHPEVAIVCGRRREKFPERSIYNALCDMEWDTPIGEARECGGDFLARISAFQQVGGFAEHMIAGEEPELCARLRGAGWKIWRVDAPMTRHDANILHWTQWWRRSKRCGYAYAALAELHGNGPDKLKRRELSSAILWGGILPALIVLGTIVYPPIAAVALVYPAQIARIANRRAKMGKGAIPFAVSVVAGKFAEFSGITKFALTRLMGRKGRLIEYK